MCLDSLGCKNSPFKGLANSSLLWVQCEYKGFELESTNTHTGGYESPYLVRVGIRETEKGILELLSILTT